MKTLARIGWRIAIIAGAVFPAIATFAQDAVRAPKHAAPAAPDEPGNSTRRGDRNLHPGSDG